MFRIVPKLAAAIVVTLGVGAICAQQPSSTQQRSPSGQPSPDGVAALVEQLADPRMLVRAAAEHALREGGAAVLAELPDPATLEAPAADAVRRIRTHLERAEAAAALEPSRVTLDGEMTLSEVLKQIVSQTGNAIDAGDLPAPTAERRIAVDLDAVPFWKALAVIEQQAGVTASAHPQRDAVLLRAAGEAGVKPPASANEGPFRIAVRRASEQLDYVNPDRRLLRTVLEVLVEPRLRPLLLHVNDADLVVSAARAEEDDDGEEEDDDAKPLAALSPGARREIPLDRPGPIRVTHDAVLPQGNRAPPLKAIDIRGRCEMELAAGVEQFDFRHLDEPGRLTRRHGGVSVTLESLTHQDEVVDLQLHLRYEADGPSFESHRSWVFHNQAWLTTPEGRRLEPADVETLSEGAGGAKVRYRFGGVTDIGGETQFTYTAPTLFVRVPIEFTLTNVPANQ